MVPGVESRLSRQFAQSYEYNKDKHEQTGEALVVSENQLSCFCSSVGLHVVVQTHPKSNPGEVQASCFCDMFQHRTSP